MNILIVYDSQGRIEQTMTPATEEVARIYRDHGKLATIVKGPLPVMQGDLYVDQSGDLPELKARPQNAMHVSKRRIKADGHDEAIISGAPSGAKILVSDGINVSSFEADGRDIRLSADVPCKYSVLIDAFPQLPFSCEIEAT